MRLHIDWLGTLGRVSARYWAVVPGWAIGIIMWLMFTALGIKERGSTIAAIPLAPGQADIHCTAPVPSVSESLSLFVRSILFRLLGVSFVVSLLPLPQDYVLGNSGEVFFALLAPLIILLVTGLIIVSWWAIRIVMFPIRILAHNFAR